MVECRHLRSDLTPEQRREEQKNWREYCEKQENSACVVEKIEKKIDTFKELKREMLSENGYLAHIMRARTARMYRGEQYARDDEV